MYKSWKKTVKNKKNLIKRVARLYDISEEEFLQGSLLSVLLHDIGKMIVPFQNMISSIRAGKKYDYKNYYRHELVSFPYIEYASCSLNRKNFIGAPLEAFAVAGHHKLLTQDLESFERERKNAFPEIISEGTKNALELAKTIFEQHDNSWKFPSIDFKKEVEIKTEEIEKKRKKGEPSICYKRLLRLTTHILELLSEDGEGLSFEKEKLQKARAIYSLTKGLLHYADWQGSADIEINYYVKKDSIQLIKDIEARCQRKNIKFSGLRSFQKELASIYGNVIAISPTGSGKTEAALFWTINNIRDMGSAKIIYLLPTMVTANKMYKRLCDYYGKENVGLAHSTADYVLRDDEDFVDKEKFNPRLLFSQSFMHPVTVATVDQLLTSGFNLGKKWALKEINASNSVIIFDEIHAYDSWSLGLIVSSMRHYSKMGARFLIMSATMPESLVNLIKKEFPDIEIVKDTELLQETSSTYYVKDCYIEDDIESIEKAVREKRKVLVVVNTVEKCQELYSLLEHLAPVCYHSQFVLKDKTKIEDGLQKVHLAITTQGVEVSLELDYDYLFTECAPPEAIGQRSGRVNRYRDPKRDSKVFIYKHYKESEKIYAFNDSKNPANLLRKSFETYKKRSGKKLSENDINEMVEEVYADFSIEETEEFKEALEAYDKAQEKCCGIFDNILNRNTKEGKTTRKIDYEKISVIPMQFFDEAMSLESFERHIYEVKIPLYYYLKKKRQLGGIKTQGNKIFCDLNYDSMIGVILD